MQCRREMYLGREFIIEHYETFYVNDSEQNHPNHRSFTDYHDFIEYAEELYEEKIMQMM